MEKKIFLFLDDYRQPIDCASYMYRFGVDCKIYHGEWVIVRSYGEFVKWIEENGIDDLRLVSYDHDLSDVEELKESLPKDQWLNSKTKKEYTGMDCANWLVNYCMDNNKPLPDYVVHSSNPAGRENIDGLFQSFIRQNAKN